MGHICILCLILSKQRYLNLNKKLLSLPIHPTATKKQTLLLPLNTCCIHHIYPLACNTSSVPNVFLHPGLHFSLPCVETHEVVDMRTITLGVPPQEVQCPLSVLYNCTF